MRQVYANRPDPGDWPRPAGVIEAKVDPASGMILAPGCQPVSGPPATEIFLAGLTPTTTCPRWTEGERRDGFFDRVAAWGGSVLDRFSDEEETGVAEGDEAYAELEESTADLDDDGQIDIRPSRLRDEAGDGSSDRTMFPADETDDVTRGFEARDHEVGGDPSAERDPDAETSRERSEDGRIVIRPSRRRGERETEDAAEQPVLPIPEEGPPANDPEPADDEASPADSDEPGSEQLPDELFEPPPPTPEPQPADPPPPT